MLLALNRRPRVRILLRSMTICPSRSSDVKDQLLEIIDAERYRFHRDFPWMKYRGKLGVATLSYCTMNYFSSLYFFPRKVFSWKELSTMIFQAQFLFIGSKIE